jgi:hypothetical protein
MTLQWIAVAVIVPLCALYAAWNLIGAAGRSRVANWLAKLPWPAAWQRRLAKTGAAASGCGCDGCDKPAGTDPPKQSIVRVHRRSP